MRQPPGASLLIEQDELRRLSVRQGSSHHRFLVGGNTHEDKAPREWEPPGLLMD